MSEQLKEKLAWWVVTKLPKRVVLYAFCFVHGAVGEAPQYEGEYKRAYDVFTKRYGLK